MQYFVLRFKVMCLLMLSIIFRKEEVMILINDTQLPMHVLVSCPDHVRDSLVNQVNLMG